MIVTVARDNKVFFRSELINPVQLPVKIREGIDQGSERKIYIRADARARYGWVAEVLDGVRAAGIEQVGFLVEQRRTPVSYPQ
jgi:biopolymer transport protein TolR